MLRAHGYDVVDLESAGVEERAEEDSLETATTFAENALLKARYFFQRTGVPTLADDSGLCCDALDGAPGVQSKRWSGRPDLTGQALDDANNALLLERLAGAARAGRTSRAARYVCAAAYVDGAREVTAEGAAQGRMLELPTGNGGFGYDPYFWSDELQASFGVVSREAKGAVSHRGRAIRALLDVLKKLEQGS